MALVREGSVAAYGVLRRCRQGWKVGPLVAADPTGAAALLGALTAELRADEPWSLDTPETNLDAIALAKRLGLEPGFRTARGCIAALCPPMIAPLVYGVTTLELG
jgi:hypothetical protein